MAADQSKLGDLHELLASVLSAELQRALAAGEAPDARIMKEVREFLKDNGIDSTGEPGTVAADLLRTAVPFLAINNQ